MDAIQTFLGQLTPSTRHLFSGQICGMSPTHYAGTVGYLHFFRSGKLTIIPEGAAPFTLERPSLIFYPSAWPHHMHGDEQHPAQMLCSIVEFSGSRSNSVRTILPKIIVVPLDEDQSMRATLDLLVEEADRKHPGWQASTDRLFEYLIVQIIRVAVEMGMVSEGVLAGLGDTRLARSLEAMHNGVDQNWTLAKLATLSGMSRARYSARFSECMGVSPMEYLSSYRLNQAAKMVKCGVPVKTVAAKYGFSSASVFSRAFTRSFGKSPSDWLVESKTP